MSDTPMPSVRDQLPLSPTPRTTLQRHHDRSSSDRRDLYEVLEDALICHLGVLIDGAPMVLPTAFGVDLDGPDEAGTLYLHGSVASASLRAAPGGTLCVTCALLDGTGAGPVGLPPLDELPQRRGHRRTPAG